MRIVPFHAKFLLRNVGLGRFHTVKHTHRLLDASLAVAAAHAVHAVSHENAFIAFFFVLMVLMPVAMALAFVMVFAMFVPAAAMIAAAPVRKLCVNHECR